ncbi:MAG: twin-arginine translocase subunit TatC [Nitrospirae bacterium]|nr:twin-arginine translocase subunit TatC [Nitrospirota bacterium]
MENDKMSFFEHLGELRRRLLWIVVILFAVFIIVFNYSELLLKGLMFPMRNELVFHLKSPYAHFVPKATKVTNLVFLEPAEAFWMHIKLSMMAAFFISFPLILGQIWMFISPGLHKKEKKYVLPFISAGTILFISGMAFCFLIVLPFALGFLLTYKTESLTPMISIGNYVDFMLKFLLAFGLIFELPIAIVSLARFGIVTPEKLAKSRRYAIVIAFIAAGILTPTPDAFNQTLMAVPIIVLYEVGIIAAKLMFPKKRDEDTKDGEAVKDEASGSVTMTERKD